MAIRTTQSVPVKYKPFGVMAQLDVTTGAKLTQTYDLNNGGYSPNHATDPVILKAVYDVQFKDVERPVTVAATESPTDSGSAAQAWRIDGVRLSDMGWTEGTDYELADGGLTLKIKRNVPAGETMSVKVRLRFTDSVTHDQCFIDVDQETLTCVSLAEAQWTLQLDSNQLFYNSEADDRTEYDYCVAHGITPPLAEADTWASSYMKKREVIAAKGSGGRQTTGYGYVIVEGATDEVVAWLDPDGTPHINDVVRFYSLSHTEFWMDCRTLTEGGTGFNVYLLLPLNGGGYERNGAMASFTAKRVHPHRFTQEHANLAPVEADATDYLLEAKITVNGQVQDNPEAYFDIEHFVCETENGAIKENTVKVVGHGKTARINPQEAGIRTDTQMSQGLSVDFKKPLSPALCDVSGYDYWTDNGKILLI